MMLLNAGIKRVTEMPQVVAHKIATAYYYKGG